MSFLSSLEVFIDFLHKNPFVTTTKVFLIQPPTFYCIAPTNRPPRLVGESAFGRTSPRRRAQIDENEKKKIGKRKIYIFALRFSLLWVGVASAAPSASLLACVHGARVGLV